MALTKVTGQVINDSTGLVVGVTTVGGGLSATDGFFSGIVTAVGDASFSGNVSVGGTLTYEDVTNIDAVGLITARNGVVVGSGITLSKDGDIFATGITTISENLKVGTGVTISPDGDGFYTGVVTATSFKGDGSQLSNITSTTINNNADNRLITGSGTANTLEGESTLTFDGTTLKAETGNPFLELSGTTSNGGNTGIHINANANHWVLESDNYTSQNLFSIKDGTPDSSTARLIINSSGNVTKPTQCSVAVRMSSNKDWPGNNGFDTDTGRLEFDTEVWDIGSNFNTSNYTFTAPVAGRYLMNYILQVESFTGFQWIYAYPVVDDNVSTTQARGIAIADFGPGYSNSASATYWAYSHSLVANLQAGDNVKFKVRGQLTTATIKGGTESQWNIDLLA